SAGWSRYVVAQSLEEPLRREVPVARIAGSCVGRVESGNREDRIGAERATIAVVAEAWQRCRMPEMECAVRTSAPHARRAPVARGCGERRVRNVAGNAGPTDPCPTASTQRRCEGTDEPAGRESDDPLVRSGALEGERQSIGNEDKAIHIRESLKSYKDYIVTTEINGGAMLTFVTL